MTQTTDLLHALQEGPLTTGEIRAELGIGMPATRVFELRERGHTVITETVEVRTRRGASRVARYRLIEEAPAEQAAQEEGVTA
ncbi:Helix-turn-helix domain-containing protein [Thiohalospira halophila DSM 15071]|uniref:Helix-turn-helix domain-containing protein n=1 Tax=Thiohalospira halophila DSM 15071 TaxID=1123397 RepID=A0A1I1U9D4_9GAMM|nr:helix-turn-helix domain-containing protein [Thiohalospira halophila]SFD67294.1 Helix-turn-helix domain-containing protein [Thiohalospira halophila DSM 15071]